MSKTLYLHVGASKCGSSALQSSLSLSPTLLHPDGRQFQYVCAREESGLLASEAIQKRATRSIYGYVASHPFKQDNLGPLLKSQMNQAIRERPADGLILSSEAWVDWSLYFEKFVFDQQQNLETEVLMFIRPPLDWINSAWWQWGAWSGQSFQDWLPKRRRSVNWLQFHTWWRENPYVSKVHLHTTAEDVTETFSQVTGLPLAKAPRANVTGDAALLRMMQRHPFLRRGVHQSWVEFFYARHAPGPRDPAPWVVPMEFGATLLAHHRENQKRLLDLIDPEVATAIENDPRWWDITAYEEREVAPAEPVALCLSDYIEFYQRTIFASLNYLFKR